MDDREWKVKRAEFLDLLENVLSDANDAYEVLENYEAPISYQLSLGYLNMSFVAFLEARKLYELHEDIQHYEIEPFFKSYGDFKFQLKKVITENDDNTSWLHGSYERFRSVCVGIRKFIENSNSN
ncbi:hypothetical protein EBB07_03575 [Paenibacillaceae bacterium]|nr:hypothetical protein EBB07_03575 [Paenibacillaceae bacterium]